MVVVVVIASPMGARASKEYDTPTVDAAIAAAERELRGYPTLQIVDIWIRDENGLHEPFLDPW